MTTSPSLAKAGREDDYQPLWDAYIAALYLINRYRHLHAGRSVRDLDEAEVALEVRKKKLDQWAATTKTETVK